ncbi:MAG: hypothetical protein A3I77_04615 [Gammaproteobacteria bacterium RIFCSPLOWO2_02_FULL_42_14]|nr:MAG: hypothetical protein A3B71_05915 [Gammaproteobacteria bacterium RIFCSPHIGHO2_02_FULL_42_43]OGT28908.1 MAG: hypothetical protein A2624_04960 [Gammaproteobacteria bacterium RIFCSPHIGHO2_01_FULL_42_8]OGT51523.1 MAG: hypothetical protein A3E54_05680 [Gammaproteobacteria bacterium RIFCSPHIGHO2_12_FULL_41_25]OGT62224.1 MAG: hypothetical protein A3I77_04615 [Gammaproteobacteria bacterium RIFCSPLOWO2_02_FULL_42_14]OGT85897.1 MAG: hypothetical protein A3G86_04305 [Gammaproteobacteria bacterium R
MSKICYIGLLLIFTLQMAANFFTPIWSPYTEMLGGGVQSAGIAIFIFTWGTGIFSILTPLVNNKLRISDHYFLVAGIFIDMLAVISYFFIHHIHYFYIAQLVLALGAGIQIPAFYVLYEKNITDKNRGIAWGSLDSIFYFSVGLASLISAFLFHHFGIYGVFSCMLLFTLFALVLSFFYIRDFVKNMNPFL